MIIDSHIPNKDFCSALEYLLTRLLRSSSLPECKGFWCDGVSAHLPDKYYQPSHVSFSKQLIFRAFSGKTGQEEYELILHLSSQAVLTYTRQAEMSEHLPDTNAENTFDIDVDKRRMWLTI